MLTAAEQQVLIASDHRQAPGGRSFLYGRPVSDPDQLSDALASIDSGDSPVQQGFKNEVDVNTIVARFGVGRAQAREALGVYADFSGIYDYEDAVSRIEGAQSRFMTLPAEVRERFANDPGKLIAAANGLSEEEFAKLMDPPKVEVPPKAGESPAS